MGSEQVRGLGGGSIGSHLRLVGDRVRLGQSKPSTALDRRSNISAASFRAPDTNHARYGPPNPTESLFLAIRQLLHPMENEGFVYFQAIGVVTAPESADSLIAQPIRPKKPV